MATLHVHLQDGFVGEPVTVRVGPRVALERTDVKTRPQLGLAARGELPDVATGPQTVSVTLPARSERVHELQVEVSEPVTYLGLSVDDSGTITHRISTQTFGYL